MKTWALGLFIFLSTQVTFGGSERCPLSGTYAGFVRMEKFKIPLVMNVIYYSEGGDNKAAFLVRLSLGGFRSHEYQAYSYILDHFDSTSPVLDLNSDQDISFFSE